MTELAGLRRRAFAALVSPPQIPLSEWIEANIVLPQGLAAAPGPMKLYPQQRGIADAIGHPEIPRVTVLKAARIGYTVLLSSVIGHHCTNDPAPILVLLPVESDCKDFVKSDLEPLFSASPALQGVFTDEPRVGQRGKRRDTILCRFFPGGSLKIIAAKAPRNLRRHTARILLIDECDGMEPGSEGSPIDLAQKRTLSFSDRKIVMGSTPGVEDLSFICPAYEASDKRIFETPCPACGAFTEILWQHIEWKPGRPETAAFRCPHCGELIGEDHKLGMIEAGRWTVTAPEIQGHAGFRLNSLTSPLTNASWGILAAEFLDAKDDPAKLQPFINTVLAQPWKPAGDELDENSMLRRTEAFSLEKIPAEVLLITGGCDVQADRLEITFAGFARDKCYVLSHVVLHGPTDAEQIWIDLDDLLKGRWQHPHGGVIGVDAVAIDAGSGGHYDRVTKFAAARASRRVFATKGVTGFARPAFRVSQTLKGRGAQRLYLIGVDGLKSLLFERLKRGQTVRFSNTLEADYFEQIASERRIVRYSRGRPEARFEVIPGRRNECLDCLILCLAAREGIPLNLDAREEALKLHPPSTPAPRVTRSRWLEQGGY
jgi:phage terminase large subunit GpA-like protein